MLKQIIKETLNGVNEGISKRKSLGLSLTKIKVFETCPYRYYLQYIEKVKVPKSSFNPKFFKKGQAFHKIIDSLIKTGVACDFHSTTLGDEVNDIKGMCEKIYESDFVQNLLKYPHYSEFPFSLYVDVDGKIEAINKIKKDADIYGIIDFFAINKDELIVVDWKTGKVAQDTEDTFLQVYLYAKAINILRGGRFKTFKVGYYYVEHETPLFKTLTIDELNEKINNLLQKAYNIPQSDNPDDFPAEPGSQCKWCPYGKGSLNICEYSK